MGLAAVGDSTDPRTVVFSTAVIMAGASMARSTEIPATASAFPSITASPGGDPTGAARRWDSGAFVGSVVLSSLLLQPVRERSVERMVYRTQATPYVNEVVHAGKSRHTSVISSHRLLRDLEGNCFEVTINAAGDEVRIELDPSECAY